MQLQTIDINTQTIYSLNAGDELGMLCQVTNSRMMLRCRGRLQQIAHANDRRLEEASVWK